MSVLIVGSVALDSIKTPLEEHKNLLGGSASYASVAASFFSPVNMVGVVGKDFPQEYLDLYRKHRIDLAGLKVEDGKTFAWSGEYEWNMNNRRTLSVELNVFEKFMPALPEAYRDTPFVLLANIAPALQLHVLSQIRKPRFVVADTMDLWIQIANQDLRELLKKVDMLVLNDSEAREFTKQTSMVKAGREILACGPRYVIIKKGEHGALIFGPEGQYFNASAFPLEDVKDPTGAGDCFIGGLMGYVASTGNTDFETLKRGIVFGSVIASFNVEEFSLRRLTTVGIGDVQRRFEQFKSFSAF